MMKKCMSPPTSEQLVNYENKSIHCQIICTLGQGQQSTLCQCTSCHAKSNASAVLPYL